MRERTVGSWVPVLVLVSVVLSAGTAWTGGVSDLPPLAAARLSHQVVVDGNLEEWAQRDVLSFQPLQLGEHLDAEMVAAMQRHGELLEQRVQVQTAYDAEALYLALSWTDPTPAQNTTPAENPESWARGGDGVEVHLRTDRVTHVACWPAGSPDQPALWIREGEGEWRRAEGAQAAFRLRGDGTGYDQEIRLPWSLLTATGRAPEGSVEAWFDFAWGGLGPDLLRELPLELLRGNTHFTCNFLTSAEELGSRGYLQQPSRWGTLSFDPEAQDELITTPLGTGATALAVRPGGEQITVDGVLDDWSEEELHRAVFAPEILGARYAVRLGLRQGPQGLYVAAHFRTRSPLFNQNPVGLGYGWNGGDCLQVRVEHRGQQRHFGGWWDTASRQGGLTQDGGPNLLAHGAQQAFRRDEDGGGYVQEIFFPWAVLTAAGEAPTPQETWRATFQPWWAGLDEQFTVRTSLRLEPAPPLTLSYDLPQDGLVSLGLYDRQGRLLRWLLQAEFRRAGANVEPWDGLDSWGKPVAAGEYELRGLYRPPLELEHVMTATNPGNPPWPTVDGRGDWLSDEANPQAAATDGQWVYLGAPGSEKGWAILAVDEEGQRRWGVRWAVYPRSLALTVAGDYVYAVISGPELTDTSRLYQGGDNAIGRALLLCLDRRTGQFARFSAEKGGAVRVATWPYQRQLCKLWELFPQQGFRPEVYGGQHRYFQTGMGEVTNALGVAASGDRVYVSLFEEDKLLVLEAESAEPLGEIPLPAPVGLHALEDGSLLAVSAGRVVAVDPATQQVRPVITDGLEAPHQVTTGPGDEIFVSDWGASFQVKVFSPQGVLLRTVGKPGGRPYLGAYDPEGMLVPRGLAVTDQGHLWVAEDDGSPRRVSVWEADSGRLVREYLGPTVYGGGHLTVDAEQPERLYTLGNEFRLDFEQQTYTPVATVSRRLSQDQPYGLVEQSGFRLVGEPLRRHQGREYLVTDNGHHGLTILMRRGEVFVPVAAVGVLSRLSFRDRDGTSQLTWDSDLGYHVLPGWWPEWFRDRIGYNYTWADLNGDGLCQEEEFVWREALTRGQNQDPAQVMEWYAGWSHGLGPDWSLYMGGFCRDRTAVYRLDVQEWTPDGAPVYDPFQAHLIVDQPLLPVPGTTAGMVGGLGVTAEGDLLVSYNMERVPAEALPDWAVGLACYDRQGRVQWELPPPRDRSAKALWGSSYCGQAATPGLGRVLGLWNWWHNFRAYLLTADGLYLDTLLDPETRIGPEAAWSESYNQLFQSPDGEIWFVNGGNNGHHYFRLRGLEAGGRFARELVVTDEDLARAAEFRVAPPEAPQPVLRVSQLRQPVVVDGDLSEWNLDQGVAFAVSEQQAVRAALQYDQERLYLAFQVRDDTPLLNLGEDWQRLFITGDCVDVMLATDPSADAYRQGPAAGDLRLLLGVFQEQPVAVLYRPVVPGTTEPVQFMATRIDEVRRLDAAQVAFRRGEGEYTLEAAIPLHELGLETLPSEMLGDVGVVFSDESGRDRVLRLYYYNQRTEMTADLSTEALLQPQEWGRVEFEAPDGRNLLRNSGFEEPLAADRKEGWFIMVQQNGAEAERVPGAGYSGRHALRLHQTVAPRVDPDNLQLEWSDFVRSIAGGHVLVQQDVPVTPGKQYTLRLRYRTEGGMYEDRRPREGRGYGAFQVWLFWYGERPQRNHDWLLNQLADTPGWQVLVNSALGAEYTLGKPIVAPEGADTCGIRLSISVASEKTPSAWVDAVEFVEVE